MEILRFHINQGRFEQAIANTTQALQIAQEPGTGGAVRLGNLGIVHGHQGRLEQAIAYTQALQIARELGNRQYEGTWLGKLGVVHMEQGRPEQAIANTNQALQIARELGDRWLEGTAEILGVRVHGKET